MKKILILIFILFITACQSKPKVSLNSNTDFYILDDTTMYQFENKDQIKLITKNKYTNSAIGMIPSRIETNDLYISAFRSQRRWNQVIFNKNDFSIKTFQEAGYADPIAFGNNKLFYLFTLKDRISIQRLNLDNVVEKEVKIDLKGIVNNMIYDQGKLYLLNRSVIKNQKGDYEAYKAEILELNEDLELIQTHQVETSKTGYIDLIKVGDNLYLSGWYKPSAYNHIDDNIILIYNLKTKAIKHIELDTKSPYNLMYDQKRNALLILHTISSLSSVKVTEMNLDTLKQSTITFSDKIKNNQPDTFFVKIDNDKYYVLLSDKLCIYDTKTKEVKQIDLTEFGINSANALIFTKKR